jgi:glucose/arabinose dehydrogenase
MEVKTFPDSTVSDPESSIPPRAMGVSMSSVAGSAFIVAAALLWTGCYGLRTSAGGGQTDFAPPRFADPADVAVPAGYRVELLVQDLTYPTGIAFDGEGRVFVTEGGYSYGEDWVKPRLLQLGMDGNPPMIIAEGAYEGPWNGVFFHQGHFYITEGGVLEGGRILRISQDGEVTALIENLPSVGDHHINGPVVGPDEMIYFTVGTASNSGVVGPDNEEMGWLRRWPRFHDLPGEEIILRGTNFESDDVRDGDRRKKAITGAFSAFGESTSAGERIPGTTVASGSVIRLPLDGGEPEQVAWGFRNPFGLAFSGDGHLYLTENGYDNRGSRPVWGAADLLRRVEPGQWHGWPDYSGDRPLTDPFFCPPGGKPPGFLLEEHPNHPPPAIAQLGVHSSSNGLDFSPVEFGYEGQAFIAQWGDLAPMVNKVLQSVGYKVIRVDLSTGTIADFVVNHGPKNGPASKIGGGGLERPIAARFGPDGKALYIVDFGVVTMEGGKPHPHRGTGVVWRIVKEADRP